MRADQWLMLGVVGIGAYAVYRIARAEGSSQALPADKVPPPLNPVFAPAPPRPAPAPAPDVTNLPAMPGPIAAPPPGFALETGADPNKPERAIQLKNSFAYQGRYEEPLSAQLRNLFEAFQTFDLAGARAAGFPVFALANPGKNTRWFYGRYLGPTTGVPGGVASVIVERPNELKLLWIKPGQRGQVAVAGDPRIATFGWWPGPARVTPLYRPYSSQWSPLRGGAW